MLSTRNEKSLLLHCQQALLRLEEQDFQGFMQKMVILGQQVQATSQLKKYKDNDAALRAKLLPIFSTERFSKKSFNQELAFTTFQNTWADESLARLKHCHFTRDLAAPVAPQSCLCVRVTEQPYWRIFVSDADNPENKKALDLNKQSDIEDLLKKLPETLADNKVPSHEEEMLVARLRRVLKRTKLASVDQSGLAVKSVLDKELRHQVKLGLQAFKLFMERASSSKLDGGGIAIKIQDTEPTAAELNQFEAATYVLMPARAGKAGRLLFYNNKRAKRIKDDNFLQAVLQEQNQEKQKALILAYHCQQLDEQARYAIFYYQTRMQKITRMLGIFLAAVTAFTYGGVELVATMLGFFVAAAIVWTNPWLALGGVLLLAGAVLLPFPATWTNWKVFSTYVPEFFNKIRSEYNEINTTQKKALFWGLSVFALATGVAAGGLAYTATIALPLMLGLGTAVSAIFPPLGVLFAAAIIITQTCMLIRNFADILRKEDSWKSFKAPFLKVSAILNESKASLMRRIVTWCMVAGLAILATLGLIMSCFTSTRSVGKLFIDLLHTAPEKALLCGIAIGSIGSFLSRVYFTLSSATASALILCKRLFNGDPASKPLPIPLKKIAAIAVDSALAGGFYAQNMLSLAQQKDLSKDINIGISGMAAGPTALLAVGAFLTSGARYVAIDLKHVDDPEDPDAADRRQAAFKRHEKNVDLCLQKQPHFFGTVNFFTEQLKNIPAQNTTSRLFVPSVA
jgi:hypothetical protein